MMSRFPFYKQLDSSDCGPTCLRIVASFYGKKYSAQSLRDKSNTSRVGSSFLGIIHAAEEIGFEAKAYKIPWEHFKESIQLPCIVHWNKKHFVVVYKIKFSNSNVIKVYVSDPGYGLITYSENEFLKHWLISEKDPYGLVLTLRSTNKFYEIKSEKNSKLGLKYFLKYLKLFKSPIIQFIVAMLLGSFISLIFPFIMQAVVDIGIDQGDLNLILTLLLAQLMLSLGQLGNDLIRAWLTLHITLRISILFISDFLNKLMRLPISFFDVKKIGDIMQRIGDNSRIQNFLTNSIISIVIAVIDFIVYSIVMAGYSFKILAIFIAGSILYVTWIIIFLQKRRDLDMRRFQETSSNQSNVMQLITGMQEIKLNNCEQYKLWEWERIQANLFKINTKSLALEQTQNIGGAFINQLKNLVISFIAAKLVIDGSITLGIMMSMQYIIGQLNAPLMQFIDFIKTAQDASISLERLGEIYGRQDEESEENPKKTNIPDNENIEFRNVVFQYGDSDDNKVLDNVNFIIKANKINAIVGVSGSGKTTILKLLLGFYKPVGGNILLGNSDIFSFSDRIWRSKCGVVMQEGFIFSDTIMNNIGISSDIHDIERIKYAAKIANIEEFISSLPLGYNTIIGMEGCGISSGQKQRILIARAVYKNPQYIFMDEATNALDASNERVIMNNLEGFYADRTVVLVAHRLSTVKNADNIIVIDKGKIIEIGTHKQLISKKGMYYDLVKDQLELDS